MILLLGGTSETGVLAHALAEGYGPVLVSTATAIALDCGSHTAIRRRTGRLNREGMIFLIKQEGITIVVDAAHPFAVELHQTAVAATQATGTPYFRYERADTPLSGLSTNVLTANSHEEAARLACGTGKRMLLTTGSRYLKPYIEEARNCNVELFARVLSESTPLAACREAGIKPENIIGGRGPFSTEKNRALIRALRIEVLVTKDSGPAGGVPEKLAAAEAENCKVVLIRRPIAEQGNAFRRPAALLAELCKLGRELRGRKNVENEAQ